MHVLRSEGLPADSDAEISASLRVVAHDRSAYAVVWALAEALLQHDELAASWRARHVVMVERMIGGKSGTGGSSGAPLPALAPRAALLPAALGPALGALSNGPRQGHVDVSWTSHLGLGSGCVNDDAG